MMLSSPWMAAGMWEKLRMWLEQQQRLADEAAAGDSSHQDFDAGQEFLARLALSRMRQLEATEPEEVCGWCEDHGNPSTCSAVLVPEASACAYFSDRRKRGDRRK